MDRRAKFALTFLLVAFVVSAVAPWTVAQVTRFSEKSELNTAGKFGPQLGIGDNAGERRPNAMPAAAGPAIVDVVYFDDTGDTDDVLWLIFNKDVDPTDFIPNDILFSLACGDTAFNGGLSFDWHEAHTDGVTETDGKYANVLEVSGFADQLPCVLTVGDYVSLRNPKRIGPDYDDATPIAVKANGLAITKVEIFWAGGGFVPEVGRGGVLDNADTVRVYLTHEVTAGVADLADARGEFDAPELGVSGDAPNIVNFSANDRWIDVAFDNNVTQGKVREGITAFRFDASATITGRRSTTNASPPGLTTVGDELWVCSENVGPRVLHATNNLADSTITVVFSDDIDPAFSSITTATFFINEAWVVTGVASQSDGDNIIEVLYTDGGPPPPGPAPGFDGPDGAPQLAGPELVVLMSDIYDHQGNVGIDQTSTFLGEGLNAVNTQEHPDIVQAYVRDDGISESIDVYFNTPFTTAPPESVFNFRGLDPTGMQVNLQAPGNLLTIRDYTGAWEQGDRIFLTNTFTSDDGTFDPFAEVGSNDTCMVMILDGVDPITVDFTNATLGQASDDTSYIGFDEIGSDDSAYYLLFARRATNITAGWAESNVNGARVISDPSPGTSGTDLNQRITATYVIDVGSQDTEGIALNQGDDVFFAFTPVDKEGNWDSARLFGIGSLVAGPLSPPRDTTAVDDNLIVVFGTHASSGGPYYDHTHYICGEPTSAPTDADSVFVFADSTTVDPALAIGRGVANADGSWGYIQLANTDGETIPFLYLRSGQIAGNITTVSAGFTQIINDVEFPTLVSVIDPTNFEKCYSGDDTLRLLVNTDDQFNDGDVLSTMGENPLMCVWIDLSALVSTAGADSIPLISLGANQRDDDNDWADIAYDGIASPFHNNGNFDPPEPYIDENGDGVYTPGEPFIDLDLTPDYTDDMYDAGDEGIDVNDPDENGYYYLNGYFLDSNDLLADPNGVNNFAVLEDVQIPVHVEDNAVLSDMDDVLNFGGHFDEMYEKVSDDADDEDNPLSDMCPAWSLEHHFMDDTLFVVTEDSQAPTVSEISFLETQVGPFTPSGWPGDNMIFPGDRCYTLPSGEATPWFNLADSTLSDDDVTMVALQINAGAGWEYLCYDRPGDANNDGAPGILDYDDDGDGFADLDDPEVANAMEEDAAADVLGNNDGIHRQNDNIDNDDDAFFRYNPIYGTWLWFNIDETGDNNIDDDGDGNVDNESESYNEVHDDDEDGMTDGSTVAIAYAVGQRINDIGGSGTIWVRGFKDPANVAFYSASPTGSQEPVYDDTAGTLTIPNNLVGAVVLNSSEEYPNKYVRWSQVNLGADNLGFPVLSLGAPNIIHAAGIFATGQGAGLVPMPFVHNGATDFGFDYMVKNEKNLNARVIQSLYGIPDGVEFEIRAVAFDKCYQGRPDWAVPLCLAFDSTAPTADIPDSLYDVECDVTDSDVNPEDGILDGTVFTLVAPVAPEELDDVARVQFQMWNAGTDTWDDVGAPDESAPYSITYQYPGPLSNNPPALADTLYFRAIAWDHFDNAEDDLLCGGYMGADSLYNFDDGAACWELMFIVEDCTAPRACLCQVGYDYDLSDGALVPSESAVDLSAWFTDGDGDSTTNDVVRILFEYRPVGTNTWLPIESLTGVDDNPDSLVDVTGIHHPVIYTGPDTLKATVTWDTRDLATGSYELHAVAFDIEGNFNGHQACIFSVTVDDIGLRAYVQPCVMTPGFIDSLYANVYIHDVAVASVEFQYYEDTDQDGIDNDGNSWHTIATKPGVDEPRGDVILRAGTTPYYDMKTAGYGDWTGFTYMFYDVDGDGYNPVDPIVLDDGNGTFGGGDVYIITTNFSIPSGATLTDFAADEYFADANNNGIFDGADWVMLHNEMDGNNGSVDFWCAAWDVSGFETQCLLVRAVATDALGNVDDDDDDDGVPDSSPTEIWTETCCIDPDVPLYCVTSYIDAGGDTVAINGFPACDYVAPQECFTLIAELIGDGDPAEVDSVVFEYSTDEGFTWYVLDTDIYGPDFTAKYYYADSTHIVDRDFNFRARAYKNGNTDVDPNQCKICLTLGENQGPETDIVVLITAEGDTLITNTVLRGNLDPFCIDPTVLYMHVTAEDNANIDSVWVMYRKAYGVDPADTTDWMKAVTSPTADDDYPYEFNWDVTAFTDGVYEFFPRAIDEGGNVTPTFGNPFMFSVSTRTASVVSVEKNGLSVSSLTPGEEVVIKAELDTDPSDNNYVFVHFYYQDRIEGEVIELISNPAPIYAAETDYSIYGDEGYGTTGGEVVYVGGVPLTYGVDYTITSSDEVTFVVEPADTITIDYNITGCKQIDEGDYDSPYSVAWDADSGSLVPNPINDDVTHYSFSATAIRDFPTDGDCEEDCTYEGFVLPVNDTEAPDFAAYGFCSDPFEFDLVAPLIDGLKAGDKPALTEFPEWPPQNWLQFTNWPGNAVCATCGGSDINEIFGDCKCKFTGIENQFFVTGDDDIVSVEMSIAGNPAVSFDKYVVDEDLTITIPITFYIDDISIWTELNGIQQAVDPDSVENVRIWGYEFEGVPWDTAPYWEEMTYLGDGIYQYMATIPLGGGDYHYEFSIDYVGDLENSEILDPRNLPWSTITIPDGDFWCYSQTTDPEGFFGGMNEIEQVTFVVTDADGNVSTHLQSGHPEGGALGQTWVTYDRIAPVVKDIWVSESVVGCSGDQEIQVNVTLPDIEPATADIIEAHHVAIQVSMDDTKSRWRTVYVDIQSGETDFLTYFGDGGWGGTFTLPDWMNPSEDGIDNDRDGLTDEEDEEVYTYSLRAVTRDDCWNTGFSCGHPRAQDPEVCAEITVDCSIPQACLTSPADGEIFAIGDVVDLTATSSDADVDHVHFQYWVNGDWQDIDCTPLNDHDDLGVVEVDGEFTCSWDTSFLAAELAGDFYVRLRAVAVDEVGNEQEGDPELECDINIVMNDVTGPVAAIMMIGVDCQQEFRQIQDPYLVVSGGIIISGPAVGWNAFDVATVTVELSTDEVNWDIIGVVYEFDEFTPEQAMWYLPYDTDQHPDGSMLWLRAFATDADGNVQNDEDNDGVSDSLPVVALMMDHTAPTADLIRFGPEGDPLRPENGGLNEHDLITGDYLPDVLELCDDFGPITVWAIGEDIGGDAELRSVSLQFLDDVTNVENATWRNIGYFQYRDAPGDGVTPDGTWVLEFDSLGDLADDMMYAIIDLNAPGGLESAEAIELTGKFPAKEYRFRAYTVDYACNTNEDEEGMWLMIDHVDPEFPEAYAGNKSFEGGETPVLVAGGDTVPLAFIIDDRTWDSYEDSVGPGYHSIQHQSSGIWAASVSYRAIGTEDWHILGVAEFDDNGTPDFYKDDLWRIDWETPMNMRSATDTCYSISIEARDNAGNCNDNTWEGLVCVQDVTPPEDTKLVAVSGENCGPNGTTYPYTPIHEDLPFGGMGIDETALAEDITGATVLGVVSQEVTLAALTPAGDASMYTGGLVGATVYFEGKVVGDAKGGNLAVDGWTLIGTGSCVWNCVESEIAATSGLTDVAHFDGPIWTTSWNTLAQNPDGSYIWFNPNEDGTQVQIRAWSEDAWGNVETIMDDNVYRLVVDNIAPTIDITLHNEDPDADEPVSGAAITAQRNSTYGVIIEANTPGNGLQNNGEYFWNQDVVVEFFWKLGTDLDEPISWHSFESKDGFPTANDNPDITRPYSFHWNTNGFRDGFGDPLIPNEDYDLGASVYDLVCNSTDVVGATKRDEHGVLTFIDTIAPSATIVCVVPDYPEYCETLPEEIWNAENVRVNGLTKLYARILDGSTDTEDVKFYYRKLGDISWILADADVTLKDLDNIQTWELTNWASAPLEEGTYEFMAEATDDAGNTDGNAPIMTIIVDRTGALFTAVTPTDEMILIPENLTDDEGIIPFPNPLEECDPTSRVLDLVSLTDDRDVAYNDSWDNCVWFEWKISKDEDVDENWNSVDMTLYDGHTGRYSSTIDMMDQELSNGLVDWRMVAIDWAGNRSESWLASSTVWDNVDPLLEITYFSVDNDEDTTIDPIDNGQITDVSHGEQVVIYATATDDEVNIPESLETGVAEVQFFVKHVNDLEWSLLGVAGIEAGFDDVLNLWHVTWNTTGLSSTGDDVDVYLIRAYAVDEAGNCGQSHEDIEVHITNKAIPLAQVSAFNPDLLSVVTKSTNERVYGLTFGEKEAESVFFQYKGEDDTEWTTLGVGQYTGHTLTTRQASLIDQDLWYGGIRSSNWPEGTLVDFRAVAANDAGGFGGQETVTARGVPGQGGADKVAADGDDDVFSELYDIPNTPVLGIRVDRAPNGATILTPNEDLGYFEGIWFLSSNYVDDDDFAGRIEVETTDPSLVPFIVVVGEDGTGAIDEFIPEMDPRADNNRVFVSKDEGNQFYDLDIDPTEGAVVTMFASVHVKRSSEEDAPGPRIEMIKHTLVFHEVTENRGSNGVVGITGNGAPAADGYPADNAAIRIPAGAMDDHYAVVITTTDRPGTHPRQRDQIELIGPSYHIGLVDYDFDTEHLYFQDGREADVWIRYDEADLVRKDGTVIDEATITMRQEDEGIWYVNDISSVEVDTVANVVMAKLECSEENAYAIILSVASIEHSPYKMTFHPEWNGWTDMDPIIRGSVDIFGADFDTEHMEVRIDGDLVFSTNDSHSSGDWWYKYPGSEFTWSEDTELDRVFWEYRHSCNWPDALKAGDHTAQFAIEAESDGDFELALFASPIFNFKVDRTAPFVDFKGGFIGNPIPDFAAGYTNLTADNITINMWDFEAGIMLRPARVWDEVGNKCPRTGLYSCGELFDFFYDWLYYYGYWDGDFWNIGWSLEDVFYCEEALQDDVGFKIDVWAVDCQGCGDDDDQEDIDEFQERTLITTITADMVAASTTPPLDQYTPGDTLSIPLDLILGDERIKDGSILELVIYSERVRVRGEYWNPGDIDDLDITVLLDAAGLDFRFDTEQEAYVAYTRSVMDCVLNVGSAFVEQRFIVDTSSPEVVATSEGMVCGGEVPTESLGARASYDYSAEFSDGAGVNPATVEVTLNGPSAKLMDVNVTDRGVSAEVVNTTEGENLTFGTYSITVKGADWLGNEFSSTCSFRIGSEKLGLQSAQVVPNPFQPDVRDAEIRFHLTKDANVTITAYDWAGDVVGQIFNGHLDAGPQAVAWGGSTGDGTALANGVYLLRIIADDGSRQEPKVVKVAIWNER